MKRYIRTNDNRIIDLERYKKLTFPSTDLERMFWQSAAKNPTKHQNGIAKRTYKEADTIKELCDAFIINDSGKYFLINAHEFDNIVENNAVNWRDYLATKGIYGAIWTNKGLIFVARINMNKELELI